ncbi:MAG: vWA domain-containing protein, partial [Thermomicrobiales bacterium]
MLRVAGCPAPGGRFLVTLLFALALFGAPAIALREVGAQSATPTAFQGNPCLDVGAQTTTQSADSPVYDYVILLDASGSMEGWQDDGSRDLSKRIMPAVKDALKQYLSELQPGSQVTIIPFTGTIPAGDVHTIAIGEGTAADDGLAAANAYIDGIVAGQSGGTHITDAITYALGALADERDDGRQHIQTLLLFTDGEGNGETDVDDNDDFIVDNLLDAISDYRQEQPFLFVKYVSLGVAVPDAEEMEKRGVDVVETVDGVPPVREVRVAIAPDTLSELEPGVAASNLLCATSGDVGAGLQVVVNDDPAELPEDVQLAFRGEGDSLTADGLPLTYTLANTPTDSGLGPFTTFIEVKSADPEVLINPSRLPVTFTVADPTPAVTVEIGEFPPIVITRGPDAADAAFALPLDLTAPDGGAVEVALDTAELADMAPGATASFVAGGTDLGESATLSADQPALDLRLTVPAADIAALPDSATTLPVGIILTPQGSEVTITGADATPQPGGAQRVTVGASLTINPQPVCSVDVAPVPGQFLLEGDTSADAVRWETTVTLTGANGCTGTLTFDDSALQQAIPGARAAFDVNGEAPLQLELGDTPTRVLLVVTAPRAGALALGTGDHPQTVDLEASLNGAQLAAPEGLTPNEAGAFAIPVILPLTIGDRPGAACTLPTFAPQDIVADGTTEPALKDSGTITCTFAGDLPVTLRVAGQDEGVTATLHLGDGAPGRTVTLDPEHSSATVTLTVDRRVAQAAEGTHTFTAQIEAQTSARNADLELNGQPATAERAVSSDVELQVQVAGEKVITIAPFDLAPNPVEVSTFDTEPDPLEWHAELDIDPSNGADGTLQIDLPADAPVSAFFKVGETTLSGPVQLAGQTGPLELVVQMPLATAQALPPGRPQFPITITLDPQGARVAAADFAREGELYRATETASLTVTSPPVAEVGSITLPPATASTSDDAEDPVRIVSDQIPYDLKEGGKAQLTADDTALDAAYDGATAGFVVGNQEPQSSVTLDTNGQPITLVILIPRDALTEEGPQSVPAISVTADGVGEGVILTQGGVPVPEGQVATTEITPVLSVEVPKVTLDPGAWQPDVLGVPINGAGTDEKTWERTFTLKDRSEGANPAVTLTPENPALTARLYDGEIGEDTLLVEGEPGQPASATFAPGHDRIIAVLAAPEADLRGLGLGARPAFPGLGASERHTLPATLTIDPRGSEVTTPTGALREPDIQREPVTVDVVDPGSNLLFGIPV